MTTIYAHQFDSPGYITAMLPDDILAKLREETEKIKEANYTGYKNVDEQLAGHLKYQFDLPQCRDTLKNFVLGMVGEYERSFRYLRDLKQDKQLDLVQLWINFQKKHDFNPVHNHNGVMSFVIWLKIPYDIETEMTVYKGAGSETNCTSMFEFVYTDSIGNICNKPVPVNKNWEGVICMFPARMKHCVQPFFTSDDFRISIAGNIDFI
jgi:hypothetical protein